MSFKAVRVYLIQLFVMLFVAACSSGSSDDTGNVVTGTSGRIALAVLDSSNNDVSSIPAGNTVTAQVTLTNTNGLPVSGNQVTFTTSSGTLSASSRLTDSNGVAIVTLDSSGLSASVVTISAAATYNGEQLSISSQFEVEEGTPPTLELGLEQNGQSITRFSEGESTLVKVKLSNSSGTVSDTLVSFSTTLGTLSPASALTDSNGEAEVTLTAAVGQQGAAVVTATATVDGQTLEQTFNYEIAAATPPELTLAILDSDGNAVTHVDAGTNLTVEANFNGFNGVNVSHQNIAFSATAGSLSAPSQLTTSDGSASVSFDTTGLSSMVVSVTATTTFDTVSYTATQEIEIQQQVIITPTISLSMEVNGVETNRVNEGDSATVKVNVTQGGVAITNNLVSVTAGLGTLATSTVLTDDNGDAEVTLDTTVGQAGAADITATATVNGQAISQTFSYEIVQSIPPALAVTLIDSNGDEISQAEAGTAVSAQARFTGIGGDNVADQNIAFATSAGTLSASSQLTNSSGLATVSLDTDGLSSMVVSVTATTTFDGVNYSATQDIEIEQQTVQTPSLQISMEVNGVESVRFDEGESAVIKAVVISSVEEPVADTVVSFGTSVGALSLNSTLTNDEGEAAVTLSTDIGQAGTGIMTVSVDVEGQTLTETLNFEILELDSGVLSLALLDQNNLETSSITQGNELSVNATLVTSSGTAVTEQAIDFTSTSGEFSAPSRLTGSTGLAIVTYDSTNANIGVVTITATSSFNGEVLTASKQVEVLEAVAESNTPNISITFKKDGTATNRMQADESAQIGVVLTTSEGDPITDAIVNFTADLGTLVAGSALTGSDGVAEVTVTGVATQLGAGIATATATVENVTISDSLPYEVVDSDVVTDTTLKLGYLDDDGVFQSGIKSKLTNSNDASTISAGGTLGIEVGVFDQDDNLYTSPLSVAFTSTCVVATNATIDATVTTINGIASTTFEDQSCATAFGNQDTIVSTVTVNSTDLTATHTVNIQAEALGSIEFVSAEPESIVLKGTGGQGKQETSTLTFLVKGELGNVLSQQDVDFLLNTEVGGLSLASSTGVTNSEGLVSAKVISGTVPTSVRVTASVSVNDTDTITTQSDLLSVNTGLPDQNSMTIALSERNPEARNRIGTQVTVFAYLADSFNNPVPDGTTVSFTSESGFVDPSCNTVSGTCNVMWTSAEPFEDDHRVTILATAFGQESFIDVNGNNLFDDDDGVAVDGGDVNDDGDADTSDDVESGFGRENGLTSGFVDMSEAWRDDNENRQFDSGEKFFDDQLEGASINEFDSADGKFNGLQCEGQLCASSESRSIRVRKAIVLVTSSSSANYRITDANTNEVYVSNFDGSATNDRLTIANGGTATLTVELSDTASQILANGTSIQFSTTGATLIGASAFTIANSIGTSDPSAYGGSTISVDLENELDAAETGEFVVTVTSPSGITTTATLIIDLLGP